MASTSSTTDTRFCPGCKQRTIHNRGKKEGTVYRWRCTYCGHPVTSTQDGKRSFQTAVQKKQADKAEMRRKLGLG